MKRFYIAINQTKDPDGSITRRVTDYLKEAGAEYVVSSKSGNLSARIDEERFDEANPIPDECDCILVLGGDGTLIRAVSELYSADIPFVCINLGHLGYLAQAELGSLEETLGRLVHNDYTTESRMMLKGEIIRDNACIYEQCSLNDVTLSRYGRMQVLHFDLFVDGTYLNTYVADGMIIATPTGSTAYNLSAGGPICFPQAELFVATPVCPHTMNTRSLVLPPHVTIELKVLDEPQEEIFPIASFDGGYYPLQAGDIIRVRSTATRCRLIKLNQTTFVEKLREKMKSI